MPAVSVLITNYNHAPYLKQRIDSVLNQTFTDFEIIIIDDCSTDNSAAIIEQYKTNEHITQIVLNETNSGSVYKQWDRGIEIAKGEYIWIAQSDDWCETSFLETIMTGFNENPKCAIGYCQSYCVDDSGNIKFQSHHTRLSDRIKGTDFIKHYMLVRNPLFNASMAVLKKNAYLAISKNYINYKLTGDYLFWIELSTQGDVFISGRVLNYFRANETNVSVSGLKKGFAFMEYLPLHKELLDRNVIDKNAYQLTLKRTYSSFRFLENKLPKENAVAVRKMFSSYYKAKYTLDIYFYQNFIRALSRKWLRI